MSSLRRRSALCAVYLGSFLATLDISIVNVALPTMQTALQTDIAGLQWVVNAYAICLAAFMLSAGPMADRHGHKRSWLAGVLLFTVGSALCGWAPSLAALLAGRAVQGVAAAFLICGAMPILTHAFPDPKARMQVIGGWSAFNALALMLGPLVGGLLLRDWGWQSIFLINLPVGALAIALGSLGIDECRYPDHAARDPWGQALSILALGALTLGVIEAGVQGWAARLPLLCTLVAALALVAFVMVERRVPRPLLPLGLLRERPFAVANLASFVLGFSYYTSLFFFSIYLQEIQGFSPAEAGWRLMPQFVATLILSVLFGRLSRSVSLQWLTAAGYGLSGLALLWMAGLGAHSSYPVVVMAFGLLGVGAGLAVPATSIAIMRLAPGEQAGAASATMNALRQSGMTLGIALLGAVMSERAVGLFSRAAGELGVVQADSVARSAITQHVFPSQGPALQALFVPALEGGFQLAMLVSGLACLVALGLLLRWPALHPAQAVPLSA